MVGMEKETTQKSSKRSPVKAKATSNAKGIKCCAATATSSSNFKPLTRSMKKSIQEKKRRKDLGDHYGELMGLLLLLDPELGGKKEENIDLSEATIVPSANQLPRADLLDRAIVMVQRMYQEKEEWKNRAKQTSTTRYPTNLTNNENELATHHYKNLSREVAAPAEALNYALAANQAQSSQVQSNTEQRQESYTSPILHHEDNNTTNTSPSQPSIFPSQGMPSYQGNLSTTFAQSEHSQITEISSLLRILNQLLSYLGDERITGSQQNLVNNTISSQPFAFGLQGMPHYQGNVLPTFSQFDDPQMQEIFGLLRTLNQLISYLSITTGAQNNWVNFQH